MCLRKKVFIMDKNDRKSGAAKLLRAISDVDDSYIEEAISDVVSSARSAPRRKASVSPIPDDANTGRPGRGFVTPLYLRPSFWGTAAAVALVLLMSVGLIRFFARKDHYDYLSKETYAEAAMEQDSLSVRTNDIATGAAAVIDDEYDSAVAEEAYEEEYEEAIPEEAIEEESIEEKPESGEATGDPSIGGNEEINLVNPMTEAEDIDELCALSGFEFDVPEVVNGSSSRRLFYYNTGIAEAQYYDASGQKICSIRKAPSDGEDITGVYNSFSQEVALDVDGTEGLRIFGNGDRYQLAVWERDDYSFAVITDAVYMATLADIVASVR